MKETIYTLINQVPINASLDLTIPIWGLAVMLGSGVAAVVSLYISLVILKDRFESMKTDIAKLRQENIDQSERHTKELAAIKEMIYELLAPNNDFHLKPRKTR
jgi:prefoldin subunit 5